MILIVTLFSNILSVNSPPPAPPPLLVTNKMYIFSHSHFITMTVKNNDIYVGPEKSCKNYKRRNFTLVNIMACNFDTIFLKKMQETNLTLR